MKIPSLTSFYLAQISIIKRHIEKYFLTALLLSKLLKDLIFDISQEEWKAIRSLADDRNTVTKKVDKGSCAVIQDHNDYITEAEKQFSNKDIYKQVSFEEKHFCDFVERSNRFFRGLKLDGHISEK